MKEVEPQRQHIPEKKAEAEKARAESEKNHEGANKKLAAKPPMTTKKVSDGDLIFEPLSVLFVSVLDHGGCF